MPIGYGIAVTAMQMLDVYTTIANHGVARPPRLVAATIDADGKRHDEPLAGTAPGGVAGDRRRRSTGCSQKVVNEGTGMKAQIPGYPVAGKTGTARKAPYDTGEYNASFAGFAPAGDPRLAAIVVIDEPRGQRSTAPTPPRRCSRRSCGSRSPTSGCRRREPRRREPPRRDRPVIGSDRVPGTLTPIP